MTVSLGMVYVLILHLHAHCGGMAILLSRNLIVACCIMISAICGKASLLGAQEPLFASLEQRLIADGLDQALVERIYRNPETTLEPGIIAGNMKRKEKTLNYQQFLTDEVVARSYGYLDAHRLELQEASRRFGVQPSIIVAVLTVESGLGTYIGRFLTVNVLSTMAVADDPEVQKKIIALVQAKGDALDPRKDVHAWLRQRAARGYTELKAFLNYSVDNNVDPFSIKGSSEGAIGIPQFLPSNIKTYAYDSTGDGVIDLFDHGDAIASVASFLKNHHWHQARSATEKKKVLLAYNRSTYYADTICRLADRLEKMEATRLNGGAPPSLTGLPLQERKNPR